MKKIILSFILLLFVFSFVLAAEPTFTASQTSAYDAITNSQTTQTPNLDGLSEEDLSNLMKNKVNDPNYNTFISKMSDKDFDRAIEKDPSLIGVISRDGSTTTLNRLDARITKDSNYINAGSDFGLGADRRKLKSAWLEQKGFTNENGGEWGTVQVASFDDKTGLLGVKTANDGVTQIDTEAVALACGKTGKTDGCIKLTDSGEVLSQNGIKLSGGKLTPSYAEGQINFKVEEGTSDPIIDVDSFDASKGQVGIHINAPNTRIVNKNSNLGFDSLDSDQLIATDTNFDVITLGNGGLSIAPIGENIVDVYTNAAGAAGTRKLMGLNSGAVNLDYETGICEFTERSNANVFDGSGNKLFNSEFTNYDVLTTRSLEYVQDYSNNRGAVLELGTIYQDNVISVRDGLLSGAKVYAKPSENNELGLTLDDFANGVYFQSDVSAGGRITQKIVDTDVVIEHEAGKGSYFSAGTPGLFKGVSESIYGTKSGEKSQIVFDEGYIFGIGKDTVKVYSTSKGMSSTYNYESVDPSPSGTQAATKQTETATYIGTNAAIKAKINGLSERFDALTDSSNQAIDWAAATGLMNQIAGFGQDAAKLKCPKLNKENCEKALVCQVVGENCVAKSQ